MATTINAGRVAMVPKGEWDASTAYVRLDVVLYNGSSWVAIADSTGQVPAEGSTYWQLLASGVDITNYYTKTQVDGKMSGKQDTRLEVEFTMSTDIGTGVVTYTASKSVAEVMAAMQDGRDIIGKMGQGGMISENYDYYHIFADKYNALLWGRLTNDASIEFFVQQQSALTRHVIALQERLVSGASIKTVNGTSVLGSGDVTINGVTGISTQQDGTVVITVASGDTYTLNLNHVHNKSVVSSSAATVTLDAHIIYDLGTVAANKTINLPSTVDAGAEYEFRFAYSSGTIGGTAISATTVANDATLAFTAGKTYQVIISGGILYFSETTTPS